MPAPFALVSPAFYWAAVANLALSDVLSNIHSFIIIATNHCGDDMYKFVNSCKPRSGTFYMRAVTSSANFRTSNGIDKNGVARKVTCCTRRLECSIGPMDLPEVAALSSCGLIPLMASLPDTIVDQRASSPIAGTFGNFWVPTRARVPWLEHHHTSLEMLMRSTSTLNILHALYLTIHSLR